MIRNGWKYTARRKYYYHHRIVPVRRVYRGWDDTMAASRATNYLCIVRVMCFYARESGKWPNSDTRSWQPTRARHEIGRTDGMCLCCTLGGLSSRGALARVFTISLLLLFGKKFWWGRTPGPDAELLISLFCLDFTAVFTLRGPRDAVGRSAAIVPTTRTTYNGYNCYSFTVLL